VRERLGQALQPAVLHVQAADGAVLAVLVRWVVDALTGEEAAAHPVDAALVHPHVVGESRGRVVLPLPGAVPLLELREGEGGDVLARAKVQRLLALGAIATHPNRN
jgi:hypothetical protein